MRHRTLHRAITLATPFVLLATIAINAQIDRQLGRAQQENATTLRQYEWKSRTEIRKDGETKKVQLALMRYDADGRVQKTLISSTPEPDLPKFGLRKAVAQKKLQEFRDLVEELSALAQSYAQIPADRMQRFMATASITPSANLVRVEGRDVLQGGDSMTVFIDAVSRKQRRIEIQTSLDQKSVRIVSEFKDLPGGPTYMARSEIIYDGGSIAIITENFDYTQVKK